jgi:hypothetical protein
MPSNHKSSIVCIKPLGGLCNRLRAIDSAISLCKENHSYLHVIWPLNAELNCQFDELYELPNSIDKITQIDTKSKLKNTLEKIYRTKMGGIVQRLYLKYIRRSFDLVLTYAQMESHHARNYVGYDLLGMTANKRVYLSTVHAFYPVQYPFENFVPVKHLRQIVAEQTQNFDRVVGVHIRRTDNQQSLIKSPTTEFVRLMQAEISQDSNTKFFVATDSHSEEEYLRQAFPDRILSYQKQSLDRNDPKAIKDALVDLYCLSKCRKLIGSYYSSFSDTACQISGIDFLIAQKIG